MDEFEEGRTVRLTISLPYIEYVLSFLKNDEVQQPVIFSDIKVNQPCTSKYMEFHIRQPTAYCQLLTVNCLLPTAYCLLPTANCLLYCVLTSAIDLALNI
jgi:hypothetical protein